MTQGMEAIKKVQEAEARSKEMAAKAEAEAKLMLDEANKKAAGMLREAEVHVGEKRRRMLEDAAGHMEKALDKRMKEARKEAEALARVKISMRVLESVAKKAAELILGD